MYCFTVFCTVIVSFISDDFILNIIQTAHIFCAYNIAVLFHIFISAFNTSTGYTSSIFLSMKPTPFRGTISGLLYVIAFRGTIRELLLP